LKPAGLKNDYFITSQQGACMNPNFEENNKIHLTAEQLVNIVGHTATQ